MSHIAEGAPRFLSKLENGVVEAVYKHDKQFTFSEEENATIVRNILEKLPLAQKASLVSTSPKVKTPDFKNENLGYVSRNIKRVHMFAVSFVRSDLVPTMYFQVKENWKDCEGNLQYCQEDVEFDISGPSRVVRDLNDFGSFPRSLNVFKTTVKLANSASSSSFNADSSPSTVTWEFSSPEIENGVEDYLRYFRSKASAHEEKITLKNLRQSMSIWASQVSKQAFKDL
jgi:hypothetical protein